MDGSGETIIKEYNRKRLYVSLLVLVILAVSWLLYKNLTTTIPATVNNSIDNTEIVDVSELPTLVAIATISSINPVQNSFVVKVMNIGSVLGDSLASVDSNKEVTIHINSKTKVQELIYETDAENNITRSNSIEINLSDLVVGDLVYLTYRGEADINKITNIEIAEKRIATTNLVKVYEEEVKRISEHRLSYAKVKVLGIDTKEKTIEYTPYSLEGVSSNKIMAVYNDNTGFYYTDSVEKIGIKHVRSEMDLKELNIGDDIYLNISDESGEFNGPVQVFEVVKINSI